MATRNSKSMKIAIDRGPLLTGDATRGIGVYVRELIKSLKIEGVDVKKVDLSKFDIVHFTKFKPFSISIPFVKPENTKFILTIYDLIPLIYPKNYPPGIKGQINWLINKYLIHKNIDAIITISETSKKDICRFLGVDPKVVYVTYLAPRPVFSELGNGKWKMETQKRFNLPNAFALYVGDVNYNKNIPWLIAKAKEKNLPLVIVGKQAKEVEKMDLNHPEHRHLKNINWSKIIRLGFVEDSDLVKIYNLATIYIQPSLYEGFGLPALEAFMCGTPIEFYKNQAIVEVLGDGKKLPREYSWQITAKQTSEVYEKI